MNIFAVSLEHNYAFEENDIISLYRFTSMSAGLMKETTQDKKCPAEHDCVTLHLHCCTFDQMSLQDCELCVVKTDTAYKASKMHRGTML